MDDFDFIEHCGWLKSFIVGLVNYYNNNGHNSYDSNDSNDSNDSCNMRYNSNYISNRKKYNEGGIFKDSSITFHDANRYAIYNLDKVFKKSCFTSFYCNDYSWLDCVEKGNMSNNIKCRVSSGFDNRMVPITKIFNTMYRESKYREEYLIAIYSYNYLYYRHEIETMLKTPSSDYTRFNHVTEKNILNKFFMTNLRITQQRSGVPSSIEHILTTYQSNIETL